MKFSHTVTERFLRYVKINTVSQHDATTWPSTPGQWELLRLRRFADGSRRVTLRRRVIKAVRTA